MKKTYWAAAALAGSLMLAGSIWTAAEPGREASDRSEEGRILNAETEKKQSIRQEAEDDVQYISAMLPAWNFAELYQDAVKVPVMDAETPDLFPNRWFFGDYGRKPVVKSQGKYGTCWAITATSALETALLPQEHLIFSADHLTRKNAFTVDIEDGGDYLMTMAYLSGWQGPVMESEDPYGDERSPDGLEAAVHVQEMQILGGADLTEIKHAVYEYGSVQTSLYMNRETTERESSYYKETFSAYYYPEEQVQNHDVLILGWDDTFSRLKFAQIPPVDGAFICQNTWGEDFGESGIFYVSYADANIMKDGTVYSRIEPVDNYDRLYQMDDCGWQGRQGYGDETCWFAAVYTAEETEELAAVGFYATGEQAQYELWLVHDFEQPGDFEYREFLQSGRMKRAGYYTVDLSETQELSEGERFAVLVKLTVPGETNPAAVEYRADEYTQNVILEGKESYLSQYGEYWENTQERFGTNVCLKVYTNRTGMTEGEKQ